MSKKRIIRKPIIRKVSDLFSLLISNEPANNMKYPMIIHCSDFSKTRVHVKKLINLIKKYPKLRQQSLTVEPKRMNKLGLGDLVVFGDSPRFSKYDYRIELNPKSFIDSDYGEKYKEYDLVEDWIKIKRRLKKYVIANDLCTISKRRKKKTIPSRGYDEIIIEVIDSSKTKRIPLVSTLNRRNCGLRPIEIEKVSIHDNFVKIGWDLYEIDVDIFTGEESIELDDGLRMIVEEDCFGNRYLAD